MVIQLSGALPTLCAARSRRHGTRACCEKPPHVLSGDSTSSETSFSMIGVNDLLGRHGTNLPHSVYIVNILSDQGWHAAGCVLRRPAVRFIEPDNSPGNATGGYRNSDGASIPVQRVPRALERATEV
jgi:hypothetical protein